MIDLSCTSIPDITPVSGDSED